MVKLAQVLRDFQGDLATERDEDQRSVLRVASKWVQASIELQYDIFLRLQVLEGAYPITVDHWWKKGKVALPVAQKAFENDAVDPSWFSPAYSGMYGIIFAACKRTLNSYGIPLEPFDFINNALMGIPIDPTANRTLRAPFEVGKASADKIKSGIETPKSIAGGVLSRYLVLKVMNEARHLRRKHVRLQDTDEDGAAILELPDTSPGTSFSNTGALLSHIIFEDKTSPFGKKLRELLLTVFSNPKRAYHQTMLPWLKDAIKNQAMDLKEYAQLAPPSPDGKVPTAQNFSQNHWDPAWRDFFKAFMSDPSLVKELEVLSHENGVDWDRGDPLKIKPPRSHGGKLKTSQERLVQRWFHTHAI